MIREPSPRRTAVVKRVYEAEEEACAQAVELLLKKKATRPGGPNDVRKDQDAHTARKNYTA